jgi:hypothetical protein
VAAQARLLFPTILPTFVISGLPRRESPSRRNRWRLTHIVGHQAAVVSQESRSDHLSWNHQLGTPGNGYVEEAESQLNCFVVPLCTIGQRAKHW